MEKTSVYSGIPWNVNPRLSADNAAIFGVQKNLQARYWWYYLPASKCSSRVLLFSHETIYLFTYLGTFFPEIEKASRDAKILFWAFYISTWSCLHTFYYFCQDVVSSTISFHWKVHVCFPTFLHFSFEPNPECLLNLTASVRKNKKSTKRNFHIGTQNFYFTFFFAEGIENKSRQLKTAKKSETTAIRAQNSCF